MLQQDMIHMGKESSHSPQEVLEMAEKTFGEELGLKIANRGDGFIQFQGGGGYVTVQARPLNGGSEVDIEGREWTNPIVAFLSKI